VRSGKITFLLWLTIFAPSAAAAGAAPSNDLSVSYKGNTHSIQMFDIGQGPKEFTAIIQVTNMSSEPSEYRIYPSDQITGENGGWAFYEDDRGNRLAGAWFTYEGSSETIIRPSETKEHEFTISVPDVVEDGQHIAAVVVRQVKPTDIVVSASGNNLSITPDIATEKFIQFVFNKNKENGKHELRLMQQPFRYDGLGYPQFVVGFRNDGTVLEKPRGYFKIEDADGSLIYDFDFQMDSVYAGTEGKLVRTLNRYLTSGNYQVTYLVEYSGKRLEGTYGMTISASESKASLEALVYQEKVVVEEQNRNIIYVLSGLLAMSLAALITFVLRKTAGNRQERNDQLPQ